MILRDAPSVSRTEFTPNPVGASRSLLPGSPALSFPCRGTIYRALSVAPSPPLSCRPMECGGLTPLCYSHVGPGVPDDFAGRMLALSAVDRRPLGRRFRLGRKGSGRAVKVAQA